MKKSGFMVVWGARGKRVLFNGTSLNSIIHQKGKLYLISLRSPGAEEK